MHLFEEKFRNENDRRGDGILYGPQSTVNNRWKQSEKR